MTSAFSQQNCQPLPCFILYSKAKFACYSRYILTSYFCILISYDEKNIFFWVSVLEDLVSLHRQPFGFSFFRVSGWGIDLNYCDIEWFALETNRDHSVIFETEPKHFGLLLTMRATLFLLRESCPQSQIQWSSELNLFILIRLSSLIPKMAVFTLAISRLTLSNLP